MRAKKSFGQHFLVNDSAAQKIVDTAIMLANNLPILEVGPGKGVLTDILIRQKAIFRAIDADRDMIHFLQNKYPEHNADFILHNVLKYPMDTLFEGNPFVVMGNFPYNISSQIVFKIIDNMAMIPFMVGMFQKEVADRIIAPPGDKTYGAISVLVQSLYSGEKILKLSPGSFDPPPKVHSAVITLSRKDDQIDYDWRKFKSIVKITFGQRRKMLRNTLKGIVQDSDFLKNEFFNQRPEQLSVEDFIHLTKEIEKQTNNESK